MATTQRTRTALMAVAVALTTACGGGAVPATGGPPGNGSTSGTTGAGGTTSTTTASATTGGSATPTASSPETAVAAIAAGLKDRMENPGLQVYVAQGGTGIAREFGSAVLSPPRPMARGDRLMVASVTKPFVAATVMRLVEKGTLKLSDPAEKWLGSSIRTGTGITVEDLLSMRSGLPDYGDQAGYAGGGLMTSAQLLALVKGVPLKARPGTTTDYVNTNYAALDLVVQKATGGSLADAVAALVTGPAGLAATTLGGTPTARGYAGAYAGAEDKTPKVTHPSAAAGVVSSATDLGHFLQALVAGRIVTPSSLALMTRPRGETEDGGYGLGLVSYQTACGTAIGHFGRNEAYAAAAFVLPSTGRVVAVTANSSANDTIQSFVVAQGLCG